ncbi:MAG: PAS domain-containing protein [Desulfobacula sp.]|uniref:ATP-binding protein n=1 Tax=Desulfobacula sp. TaxID=2593537 RepID=UPI001DEA0856|nr:PAS domain-containing protein [Desulfobacula sp.]
MKNIKFITKIPPLILIGTIIVLFPIFTYMTLDRINRQKTQSIRLLFEKSTALIKAFEAGTRTGMMNMGWSRTALENLLRETASLPDITSLFIVNKEGQILVHSIREQTGKQYGQDLDLINVLNSDRAIWRIKQDETKNNIFQVYKKFSPIIQQTNEAASKMMHMHQGMRGQSFDMGIDYKNTIIFVELDMKVVEQADQNDIQHSIMMAVILLLIGLTGFVLVFIVQRYRTTRSSLSRIKIFSDNLVENMPIGLVAMNKNDQILSVNPAAKELLNLPLAQDLKKIAGQVLPKKLIDLVQSIHSHNRLIEKELSIKDGKGKPIILDVVVSPLSDKDGASLGALVILRDLTELSLLKDEIERNKRLAAIGRLAAGVAHEIRNPLSSLKGYATFFKEIFDKGTQNFDIADVMIKEVDRLNHVVSELVEIARPVQVSQKPVLIKELVEDSIKIIEHDANLHNIAIKIDLDEDIGSIYADKERLNQALLNLYLNAIQSMENSGENSGSLHIQLFRDKSDHKIIIRISDTGSGIKKEDLPNIFEPYFTTKLSGTGLGLAIVHNIVKAHKGKLKVKSEPGQGTIFTIILPDKEMNENE